MNEIKRPFSLLMYFLARDRKTPYINVGPFKIDKKANQEVCWRAIAKINEYRAFFNEWLNPHLDNLPISAIKTMT